MERGSCQLNRAYASSAADSRGCFASDECWGRQPCVATGCSIRTLRQTAEPVLVIQEQANGRSLKTLSLWSAPVREFRMSWRTSTLVAGPSRAIGLLVTTCDVPDWMGSQPASQPSALAVRRCQVTFRAATGSTPSEAELSAEKAS